MPDRLDNYPGVNVSFTLVGDVPAHPDNHYCVVDRCRKWVQLANEYNARFNLRLAYNDASLPRGGLFDVNGDWKPDHKSHDTGKNLDVRANGGPDSLPGTDNLNDTIQRSFVWIRCIQLFLAAPQYDKAHTSLVHLHIN